MANGDDNGFAYYGRDERSFASILARLDERSKDHTRRITELEETCIKRAEFAPIQKLVYGVTAAVLLTVIGAALSTLVG